MEQCGLDYVPADSTCIYTLVCAYVFLHINHQLLLDVHITCLGISGLRCVNGVDTHTEETLLRTTLKTGYDQTVRPATPTEVTMFYSIRTLQSLVGFSQFLSIPCIILLSCE